MKQKLLLIITGISIFLLPISLSAQTISLGTASDFVLFTSNGAVSNTGITHLTGNVGSNNGSSTGFGNVNGVMHDGDGSSAQAESDLLIAYNQLQSAVPTSFPAPLLGNGQVLLPGVHSISGAAVINLDLTFNGQGNPDSEFIIQISGPLSINANAKVKLINGAEACRIFWKVEGLISVASGVYMRGTMIANNAAIEMSTNDTLQGRALSTTGAVTVDGVMANTPNGCGSITLTGPTAPQLGTASCYAILSGTGSVTNTGTSFITGDVGTNSGITSGYEISNVNGIIHENPDNSTAQASADLLIAYNYVNTLTHDIELLYPAQFGNNLVLTPHIYLLNAASVLTDTIVLNAEGNNNAVFVIKINGALSTSTYSTVKLINGAKAENVYWKIEGAVDINNYSVFKGTIIANNGAIGALNTGVNFEGRALTTSGALNTTAANANIPSACSVSVGISENQHTARISLTPNPFIDQITILTDDRQGKISGGNLKVYSSSGALVKSITLTSMNTTIPLNLPSGIYYIQITGENTKPFTGKLISANQ